MPRLTNTLSKPRRRVLRQLSALRDETQQLVRQARGHSQLSEAQAFEVAQEQVRAVRRRK